MINSSFYFLSIVIEAIRAWIALKPGWLLSTGIAKTECSKLLLISTHLCYYPIDAHPPQIINMPGDKVQGMKGNETGTNVTWVAPNATDNFAFAGLDLTSDHESGSLFPLGETVVTYTAKDKSQNAAKANFKVTITGKIDLFQGDIVLWEGDRHKINKLEYGVLL